MVKETSAEIWEKQIESDFWSVQINPYFPNSFQSTIKSRNSGNYKLFHIVVDPHRLIRLDEHILMSEIADILIIYILKGKCRVDYATRSFELMTTNLCVVNGWEPYTLDFKESVEMLVFRMPISALETRGKNTTEKIAFKSISTTHGLARVSAVTLEEAYRQLTHIPSYQDRMLFNNMASLICAGLQDTDDHVDEKTTLYEGLVRQIRRYIEENIEDEYLDAEQIAQSHNISLRYLNKIFENEPDTAIMYIRSLRLRLFAQRLVSDKRNLTIKEIVFSCGFSDYAHFHRVFKKHFQCTPKEYRNRS